MSARDDYHELLSTVTGLGEHVIPTEEHHQEAQRLIDDPSIPKSDLRGVRDLQPTLPYTEEDNPDAWDASGNDPH